jgi:ATPase subunit of ABC transporter with duplicated ATPase domains
LKLISTNNISLGFGGRKLFEEVNLKFTHGNCYGLIGPNGAGKSTFLKILSGEIDASTGVVNITAGERLAVLKQDHFEFDEHVALETVIMGHVRLFEIMKEKDFIYSKSDFSEEDGVKAAELESEFDELNGWEAEPEAASLLSGLGIEESLHQKLMKELNGDEKVKVLLAQALFGHPKILLLDEPTNHLDNEAISWLENFLLDFESTVIVVSHDRHFLNKVCTHIADVDFGKIKIHVGNYDFWFHSSQLALQIQRDQNKKAEDKRKDLQDFIDRFSANASKSKQASSRRKQLDKLTLDDIEPSSRKYPYVAFKPEREAGNEILAVEGLTKTIDGNKLFDDISFTIDKGDKVALVGPNEQAKTTLLKLLVNELEVDSGEIKWGVTTSQAYFPKDNSAFFNNIELNLIDWLRQFSEEKAENFIRGYLGRVLFSGEEALKKANVLSGGERVRCMLSRMMLSNSNFLLFDEPTNHLDLESITSLNDGLINFTGTMIFSSHDHEFIQTIANRIIEITPDGIIDKKITYDEYMHL